jgi:hypothetical protein
MMIISERHYSNGKNTLVIMFHYFDENTGLLVTDFFKEIEI